MAKTETRPLIQFRPGTVADDLDRRTNDRESEGLVARRDLERYYWVLERSLRGIDLTEEEAMCVLDSLNGVLHEPADSIRLLWAGVADSIEEGLDEKWQIDGDALVQKLRRLTDAESAAVVDAAERYWSAVSRGENPTPQSVGLTR